jgi:hypothetical protein
LGSTNPPKLRPNAPAEGIRSEGGPPFPCIDAQGKIVGGLTSLTPVDGQALALAMIQRAHADPGNSLLAEGASWTILRHA